MGEDASGNVVLVTGASGGIGAALAAEFAAAGHDLFLVARRENVLADLAATLGEKHGVTVDVLALDLVQRDAGARLEADIARRALSVDVLVNNAGFGLTGPAVRLDRQAQLEMMDLNMRVLVELTLRFLPAMVARGRGGVLNVGSIAGFQPGPYMAGYYASKAFVGAYTAALATECHAAGVRFTNLAPGPVATGFAARAGMERAPLFRRMQVQDAATVARAGYKGFAAGKRLVIPGFANRFAIIAGRLVPGRLRDAAIAYIVNPR
ncbi:3-oxoacyl-[acyl-carrier protein] reductase [hydrothermal vent metagenome]|uniref:3-oxoacyl-[acyl-carrier protein] reductase n=1 Tax=hydrothermal vent metagenome TaxID=652676 RepID=A0A3B0TSP9_9ZZZZ